MYKLVDLAFNNSISTNTLSQPSSVALRTAEDHQAPQMGQHARTAEDRRGPPRTTKPPSPQMGQHARTADDCRQPPRKVSYEKVYISKAGVEAVASTVSELYS